jgi:hypothetical protein
VFWVFWGVEGGGEGEGEIEGGGGDGVDIDKVWLAAGAVGAWVPSGGGEEWSGFGHAWVGVWMSASAWVWMRCRDARRWGRPGSLRGNDIIEMRRGGHAAGKRKQSDVTTRNSWLFVSCSGPAPGASNHVVVAMRAVCV